MVFWTTTCSLCLLVLGNPFKEAPHPLECLISVTEQGQESLFCHSVMGMHLFIHGAGEGKFWVHSPPALDICPKGPIKYPEQPPTFT